MSSLLPAGKLPSNLLAYLLDRIGRDDPRVLLGPGPGEDAAVLDPGAGMLLVAKSDPITFATHEIGWYAVHVNANDIAASGGTPAFFLATLLLPAGEATAEAAEMIFEQMLSACDALNVTLVGGHTEITGAVTQPVLAGTMLGTVHPGAWVKTSGARPGDRLLVSKGVPVEATAILANELRNVLEDRFSADFLDHCARFLHDPGISVVKDARVALAAGVIHAMHDPTEGGLATGLWEMAETSDVSLQVDLSDVVLQEGGQLCKAVGIDAMGAIASGALLMAVPASDAASIQDALKDHGIACYEIGDVNDGTGVIDRHTGKALIRPARDEIARLFE